MPASSPPCSAAPNGRPPARWLISLRKHLKKCTGTFETDIEVFRWHHVAASYDGAAMRLHINGEEAASEPATGAISLPERDLVVGPNLDKLTPTSPIRTWATYPSIFGIDGLIDNVTIHGVPEGEHMAGSGEVRTVFNRHP